jgi:hypothetical protein
MPSKPRNSAHVIAICSILGEISVAATLPFDMTIYAATTAGSAIPKSYIEDLVTGIDFK